MNEVILSRECETGQVIHLVLGDITVEPVEAIVNAANSRLQHGGGVAAAISRAAGPSLQEESNRIAPVSVGQAKVTGAGNLPCRYIIHAVGPRWGEGDEDAKLVSAVHSALSVAGPLELAAISLPAISTGIYGFPVKRASRLILKTVKETLESGTAPSLREVRLCIFDRGTLKAFQECWGEIFQ